MKIAINGFGRIGRNFLRTVLSDTNAVRILSVAVINIGPGNPDHIAHIFKYDTLLGTYKGEVHLEGDSMVVDGHYIKIIANLDPTSLSWADYGVEWVVEATGHFTHRTEALKHIQSGASYVLITAPAEQEDIAIVPGVNEHLFNPAHHKIVSLGSCTTNAFVPLLKVLHDTFMVTGGFMTTVHAYTTTQVLLDNDTSDMRRSRAAALNIIPTSTGVSEVLGKILPALEGVIKSVAIRVPVAKVSLIDFSFITQKKMTIDAIHQAFHEASKKGMKGILDLSTEPLVSSDFSGSNYSVVVDGLLTEVNGSMGKVFG